MRWAYLNLSIDVHSKLSRLSILEFFFSNCYGLNHPIHSVSKVGGDI
jgi:hypothetical protein